MNYHYWTQPLPNPVSWYINRMPDWYCFVHFISDLIQRFHKLEVIGTHLVEGPFAFFAFGEQWIRLLGFISFVSLNLFINLTGNYGFLGFLTTVQCIPLIEDWMWR